MVQFLVRNYSYVNSEGDNPKRFNNLGSTMGEEHNAPIMHSISSILILPLRLE